jgi:hypothetical protein
LTTSPRAGSSSTTSPTPRVRVPRHVARLVTRLVVDYFASTARLGASACRTARRHLLRLRRASGCFGTSHGSSSTTSPPPHVRVPRHVARLVVDYFDYAARPVALAHRAARRAARRRLLRLAQARRRLLRLRRASGCLGTSRGSSHGSSSTTPCAATSSCGHTGSTSATSCVTTTCLAATLALHQLRHASSRRRLLVASHRTFISTSFLN